MKNDLKTKVSEKTIKSGLGNLKFVF